MEKIKYLFFEDTLKRWHFEEILKASQMSRERVNYYLKELLKEKFIIYIKEKGKMPYYIANRELEKFRMEKKLYGLNLLKEMFESLNSLNEIKTAILFGSFSRGDFSKSSDVDLFIYGNDEQFDKAKFELKIKREIQIFNYNNVNKMKKELDPKLIPNIFKGFNIKESIEPFRVDFNG
ncbi:MAG: nucleotidyltransferase domain-containing protein [Candidatus Nanoarchaeia archaeon]|nr:nucleotidyltransferase domain-containing protein [Candidatus Nanoarchaeia archaeon]